MIHYKYGTFTDNQIAETKKIIRKQIYFLLLIVDPKTRDEYKKIDVNQAFNNLMYKIGGFNEILLCPTEVVTIQSLLEAALIEYNNPNFEFKVYRKLILDAGSEVLRIKEVD